MLSSSQSIDRSTFTVPRGLGQFVKRHGVKGDAGIVSIVLLNPKLCQLGLTRQRMFEDPTLKFNILKATVGPVQAKGFNRILTYKCKMAASASLDNKFKTCHSGKQGNAFQYIATKQ